MNIFGRGFFTKSCNCYITNFFSPPCCFTFLNHDQQYYKNQKMRRDLMLKSHLTSYARDRKLHLNHL